MAVLFVFMRLNLAIAPRPRAALAWCAAGRLHNRERGSTNGAKERQAHTARKTDKIVKVSETDESALHLLAYTDSRLSNKEEARQPQCVASVDAPFAFPCSRILNELSRPRNGLARDTAPSFLWEFATRLLCLRKAHSGPV